MSIFRPTELHKFLQETGLKARKGLSQNFLIDGNIIKKIVAAAKIESNELVIEIGSGPGALTQALLEAGARVIAIEKDASFAHHLQRLQTDDARLEIFSEDCMSFPWESFLKDKLKKGESAKVVSNLPYHLTTPIIAKLVPLHPLLSSLTLMVQKEVAVRFCAKKGSADYSSFTIFLECYCHPAYCFTIEPTCFYPQPSVHSAVVHFSLKPSCPQLATEDFFQMVRTAFQGRRKMLTTSLRKLFPADAIQRALMEAQLNFKARPEELSLDDFRALFKNLSSYACKETQL
jgi:16S rRNA (adenine1518-N6/adenine1519-N6)-dimethyltransferase